MDRNIQYADACLPPRWRVAGVPLQPFCLGHALALLRVRSRFICGEATGTLFADLLRAVYLCSRTYASTEEISDTLSRPLPLTWQLYTAALKLRSALDHTFIPTRAALFEAYVMQAVASAPKAWNAQGATVTPMGGSIIGRLRLRLRAIGIPDTDALRLPFTQAMAELSYHAEASGTLRLVTRDEEAAIAEASSAA